MSDHALPLSLAAPVYNEAIVKKCVIATVFWGVVAFLVGVYIATELAWPQFNLGLSFINFGRLRPVHTSAAIFAFGGSALFATSFGFTSKQFFDLGEERKTVAEAPQVKF